MKYSIIISFILIVGLIFGLPQANAQVKEQPNPEVNEGQPSDSVSSIAEDDFSEIEEELKTINQEHANGDTTKIRIGKMKIAVLDDGNSIIINKEEDITDEDFDEDWTWEEEDCDDDDWYRSRKSTDDKFRPHWAGFSMGLNNYVTSSGSFSLPDSYELLAVNSNKSLEVNLNVAQLGLNIVKRHVGLVTGVGFKWNNYKFRNENTVLVADSTPLYYYENPTINGKMSKLTTCYLVVPLLLEFQIPTQGNVFYISAGVEGGLKIGTHTKIKTLDDAKYKDKSDFFTTAFDYRLAARMGFGHFGIYATYAMMPLFEKDNGPELYPVSAGISLNF